MARFAVLRSHREDGVPLVLAARDAEAPVRTAADARTQALQPSLKVYRED
jgi:hypothetical protein